MDMCVFKSQLKTQIDSTNVQDNSCLSVEQYNSVCKNVLDDLAPMKTRQLTDRLLSPWFSLEEKRAKSDRRKAERKYTKTGLLIHKQIHIYFKKLVDELCRKAKKAYYNDKFLGARSCKQMYCLSNELFGNQQPPIYPKYVEMSQLLNIFLNFFTTKVENIRLSLESECHDAPTFDDPIFNGLPLEHFQCVSGKDIKKLISDSATKSCELDPIPTSILKDCLPELLTGITSFINESLMSGIVPAPLKDGILRPLLKKVGMNHNELKNYRPVTNLTFVSKILEKVVFQQILSHIDFNSLHAVFQSAYKKYHSTETALLKVYTDLLDGIDSGKICYLNLLDLSAAFDTIDHDILLERLHTSFGISGIVLKWIKSYLTNRTYCVKVGNYTSDSDTSRFGVPQGSVLGPFLFTLYTYPLSQFLTKSNLSFQGYSDDNQLYKAFYVDALASNMTNIELHISQVQVWMMIKKLNGPKTEFMILGKKQMLDFDKPCLTIDDTPISPSHDVRNLGVIFDENLNMNKHIDTLCKTMFFNIRSISLNRDFLTEKVTIQLMISLVLSRIDYCNSMLAGLPDYNIKKLQRVQNCAAKVCFKQKKSDHVTPLLIKLHWLPVKERIDFKIALMCFNSISNCAPSYISDLLEKPVRLRELRSSADSTLLHVPIKKSKMYGERSFSFYGPKLWNGLPRDIRESSTVSIFKKRLKHFLFMRAYY